jgi:hypothetical protein
VLCDFLSTVYLVASIKGISDTVTVDAHRKKLDDSPLEDCYIIEKCPQIVLEVNFALSNRTKRSKKIEV